MIYGAGGAIGGAVARAFAREGARLFLTGRRRAALDAVANDIVSAGGQAESAEVDAIDEKAVDKHLRSLLDKTGRIDISFNAVGVSGDTGLGVPLLELDVERFTLPITAYATSYFVTARTAARHMIAKKAGVIMTLSALPARMGSPLNGGYGSAQAAKEQLTRDLSHELARHGIRVVGLRPHGLPETGTMRRVFDLKANVSKMTWEQFTAYLASTTHPRRAMNLAEVANAAAFLASDGASGMTGTIVNLSMGALDD